MKKLNFKGEEEIVNRCEYIDIKRYVSVEDAELDTKKKNDNIFLNNLNLNQMTNRIELIFDGLWARVIRCESINFISYKSLEEPELDISKVSITMEWERDISPNFYSMSLSSISKEEKERQEKPGTFYPLPKTHFDFGERKNVKIKPEYFDLKLAYSKFIVEVNSKTGIEIID